MTTETCYIDSPFGQIEITASDTAVTRVTWADRNAAEQEPEAPTHPLLIQVAAQLREYFAGTRREFDLPLDPAGGDLQQAVCRAMLAIPYGETRTYGDLAKDIGVAAQPIGQACGGNPIPIIIPCHRVLAAGGKTGGFSGGTGVETKMALLRHEGALLL